MMLDLDTPLPASNVADASTGSSTSTPMLRPMFPPTVDSTMLACFRSCPQRFFRQYVQHWKPREESVHLVAGGAFAKGLEVARRAFYEGIYPEYETQLDDNGAPYQVEVGHKAGPAYDSEQAQMAGHVALTLAYGNFECPEDSAKSLSRMLGALEFYFLNYPLVEGMSEPVLLPDGKKCIEFSFAEPLDITHPVTGDPILYTGRMDAAINFAGGVYGVDEKTTSSLGATWGRKWEMRSQFTGYIWAANKADLRMDGMLVRGVSILKTKYDTQECLTYRSKYELERWEQQTLRDVARMKRMWEEGYWDYALDEACNEYGGCSFTRVCKSQDPDSWLPISFTQRVWDPLARKQLTVEEWEASWGNPVGLPLNNPPTA